MHDSQTSNGKGNAFLKATARSEYSLDHQQKTEVAVSDQKSALEGSATHKAIPQQQLTVNINQTQEKGGQPTSVKRSRSIQASQPPSSIQRNKYLRLIDDYKFTELRYHS